jgi:hypothetical protein
MSSSDGYQVRERVSVATECYNFHAIQRFSLRRSQFHWRQSHCRGVAQPGRAPGSGPGGRRFKSSLPDQFLINQLFRAYKKLNDTLASDLGFRRAFLRRLPLINQQPGARGACDFSRNRPLRTYIHFSSAVIDPRVLAHVPLTRQGAGSSSVAPANLDLSVIAGRISSAVSDCT